MKNKVMLLCIITAILFVSFSYTDAGSLYLHSGDHAYLSENVLRLHIRARSNSEEDQNIKFALRDAVLKEYSDEFSASGNISRATENASMKCGEINRFVDSFLYENGIACSSRVSVDKSMFPDRTYGSIEFPAGEYTALRIDIGEAEGKNWWCVMYPPLCFAKVREDKTSGTKNDGENETEIRWWLEELLCDWFG